MSAAIQQKIQKKSASYLLVWIFVDILVCSWSPNILLAIARAFLVSGPDMLVHFCSWSVHRSMYSNLFELGIYLGVSNGSCFLMSTNRLESSKFWTQLCNKRRKVLVPQLILTGQVNLIYGQFFLRLTRLRITK